MDPLRGFIVRESFPVTSNGWGVFASVSWGMEGPFKGQDLGFWINWEGIEPTVDWWREIEKGSEEADNFLFLMSPSNLAGAWSLRSTPVGHDLRHFCFLSSIRGTLIGLAPFQGNIA
jgi:hypothetical protein